MNFRSVLLVAGVVLASGCVSINMNHELHKDGTSDFEVDVQSDYQSARTMVKRVFERSMAVDQATLDERENGFTYTWENVWVGTRGEGDLDSVFSGSFDAPSVSYQKKDGLMDTTFLIWVNSSGMEDLESGLSGSSGTGSSSSIFGGSSSVSSMEINYNMEPFGELVDTNGQELDSGGVRFDLTEEKDYYVKFRANSLDLWLTKTLSDTPPKPDWEIGEWSRCNTTGMQEREVELQNDAESYVLSPPETRECTYETSRSPREMTLGPQDLETWSMYGSVMEGDGYMSTFRKGNTSLNHTVLKPEQGTESYIDSEVSRLEEDGYTTAIEYVDSADRTEAYEKELEGSGTSEDGFSTSTSKRKVVLLSKHDVVHRFEIEGPAGILGMEDVERFENIANAAINKTR